MKIRSTLIAILFCCILSACADKTPAQVNSSIEQEPVAAVPDNDKSNTTNLPAAQNTATQTPSPAPLLATATQQPTQTPTVLAACPATEGYAWSRMFSPDTSYISTILPSADGNYLISGVVDTNDGLWVAKIDPEGTLLWQKKFEPSFAYLRPLPNGNFLVEFEGWSIELDTDGNVIQSIDKDRVMALSDGSHTILNGNQVMRYTDQGDPEWAYSINNPSAYGAPTTDGGAIFAYRGSYADKSVYYMPILTDIKVIKIDGNGQVWQRVYGKLVGDETLDQMFATHDGGAIIAGTHAYEELGSDYDIWLMKLNQTGGISWQTTLKSAPNMENITILYTLSQGYLVLSEDYDQNTWRLVKLSKSGAVAWQKELSSIRGNISITTAAETANGGLVIAGETYEKNSVSFIARFGPKGNLLWEKLTGFNGIENSSEIFVNSILPLNDGNILLGGGTNVLGKSISPAYGAWLANIKDEGEVLGFLTISPGKFTVINTLSTRPNTLPDEVVEAAPIRITEIEPPIDVTTFESLPSCLISGVSYPTPHALPSLTPSITPTPSFLRDLYLTSPENMQGDDVLKLQQKLLELGYDEVGVPDGIFGKMTQNAVRLFQEKNGLEVDGYVGRLTWAKLFSNSALPK